LRVKIKTMKNLFIIFLFLAVFSHSADAQLKLNIDMLDYETYIVSMSTDQTINAPLNTTSNIQIVLEVIEDEDFTATNIQSLIPGINWVANSYSDDLNMALPHLLVFNMQERSTTALPFQEGLETALFTFKNQDGCNSAIRLVENDDDVVQTAINNGYNYTQNFTVLAARGNAFNGVINSEVDCQSFTNVNDEIGVESVKIYPIPADDELTIEWNSTKQYNSLDLNILSVSGQLFRQIKNVESRRNNEFTINLTDYPEGIYTLRFQSENTVSKEYKFIVGKGK